MYLLSWFVRPVNKLSYLSSASMTALVRSTLLLANQKFSNATVLASFCQPETLTDLELEPIVKIALGYDHFPPLSIF